MLAKLKLPKRPAKKHGDVVWVDPTLIAEIEFRASTNDGKLRHSVYKGLRQFQDNDEVYRVGE
jgi:bifunctional non-homologous end joining protein LigD